MKAKLNWLALAIALAACRRDANPVSNHVERTDSAGTAIVLNLGPDRPLDWGREEVLRLGGKDDGPQAFARVDFHGLATDGDGRVYVLDQGNFVVQVFDRAGSHMRSLGREGAGPGEMEGPVALYFADNALQVIDNHRRVVVRFDSSGALLPELRWPAALQTFSELTPVSGGLVATIDSTINPKEPLQKGSPLLRRVVYIAHDTANTWRAPVDLAAFDWEQPTFNPVGAGRCPFRLRTPPVFWRQPVWHAEPGRAFANPVNEYVLDVISLNGSRASIRRDLPVRSASRTLAAAEIGSVDFQMQGRSCKASGEERADQATWLDQIPWIVDVRQAPTGEILVLRRAPGEAPNRRIDVFDARGEYTGTLPPDFPLPTAWRGTDEFIHLEHDPDGRPQIVVYRITRPRR